MVDSVEKLTKKQRKALEFRKSKEEKAVVEEETKKRKRDDEEVETATKEATTTEAPGEGEPKKKRKTRRGKKGKGSSNGAPRFLLFVGNLPYDVSTTELVTHFAAASPDNIRLRTEKGIAFLEFDGSGSDIQKKMGVALKMHHSTLRGRKINVELTVGGGGNSKNRLEKIKAKNDKLDDERKDEIQKKKTEKAKKEKAKPLDLKNVHPSRAAMMQR
ncbi:CYFA0S16e00474g1_1 [Cyberlindnera fabianii]|uniref:CYFA0S16e00474g1_1 n=1 Tax=Cyberlindnera fabianii TaxID=36022 RepID=A0A061BDC4_CYBFA|nr:Nucleolar protein 6 [Cyberlindnera fabianii]CDR44958.1 CYFA0S16e00474g1_1 [Cyberlindnera fabianii]